MIFFCNFVNFCIRESPPINIYIPTPLLAGLMVGVLQQRVKKCTVKYKASIQNHQEIVKDFFILDRKCDIIEVGHTGLPPL